MEFSIFDENLKQFIVKEKITKSFLTDINQISIVMIAEAYESKNIYVYHEMIDVNTLKWIEMEHKCSPVNNITGEYVITSKMFKSGSFDIHKFFNYVNCYRKYKNHIVYAFPNGIKIKDPNALETLPYDFEIRTHEEFYYFWIDKIEIVIYNWCKKLRGKIYNKITEIRYFT